eukprot:1160894-Pelagomonas_calceolata.AAC.8
MRCLNPCRPCVVGLLWVPVRSGKVFRGWHERAREQCMVVCSNKGMWTAVTFLTGPVPVCRRVDWNAV